MLVTSVVVFEIIPRSPNLRTKLPNEDGNMQLKSPTYIKVSADIAERRIQSALRRNTAADRIYQLGDKLLAFSDLYKALVGLSVFMHGKEQIINIQATEGNYQQMFIAF